MAIDRIPGVGPLNSDIATAVAAPSAATIASAVAAAVPNSAAITAAVPTTAQIATAVAAPSAATIASAVAAPSAATIASAVAAPSSATIASAVAAAVPTRANIQSDIGTYGLSPNAWTVISSVTFNNSASTYTFSSLSGYKTYRVMFPYATGPTAPWHVRLNGDAGNNYNSIRMQNFTSSVSSAVGIDYVQLPQPGGGSSVGGIFNIDIEYANLACHKSVSTSPGYGSVAGTATGYFTRGIWMSTASVTSITITGTTNNWASGTVYLLGAN